VALSRPELPTFDRFAAWYVQQYPDAPAPISATTTENLAAFTVGGHTAAITLIPRPIPWSQLEGPAATAWYWPDAASLRDHAAHLIVTLVDEGGRQLDNAITLTRLTAAAAATSSSVGVFWGPGRLVHSPAGFIDQARDARESNLPLFLWVDFRVERHGDDPDDPAVRLYTTGLEALGGQELEVLRFVGDPQELVGFVYNVAHYLLERRKVVNDGDTIGLTDAVQVTARRGPSMLDEQAEVIRLEFEGAAGPGDGPAR
jgi:hypothetical protein